MNKIIKNQKIFYIVSIIAIVISVYIHINATTFIWFLSGSILTSIFFIGVYICLENILKTTFPHKILKIVGKVACVLMFLFLILLSWTLTSLSGFHSMGCYNLAGKNIFTGNEKVYCNYPPWYTSFDESKNPFLL